VEEAVERSTVVGDDQRAQRSSDQPTPGSPEEANI
jgi:hypothetical protein